MSLETHDPADQATDRKAREVLDALDRWEQRCQGRHTQKRQYPRQPYRTMLVIAAPNELAGNLERAEPVLLRVWSRNLSQGGVAFIYPGKIRSERIAVCLDPETGKLWMRARIVRCRQVHDGFWEYGAEFEGRGL